MAGRPWGDLEDRSAGAGHHQVTGQDGLAQVADVTTQVIVPPRRLEAGQVAIAGGVEHAEPGAGKGLHCCLIDRPCALGPAEHQNAYLV